MPYITADARRPNLATIPRSNIGGQWAVGTCSRAQFHLVIQQVFPPKAELDFPAHLVSQRVFQAFDGDQERAGGTARLSGAEEERLGDNAWAVRVSLISHGSPTESWRYGWRRFVVEAR